MNTSCLCSLKIPILDCNIDIIRLLYIMIIYLSQLTITCDDHKLIWFLSNKNNLNIKTLRVNHLPTFPLIRLL